MNTPTDDELRVLVDKLDLEQKIRLLTGADFFSTHAEPAIGLRRMVLSDGPSGVRGEQADERDPSLNLPSPTALGATWDPSLAYRYGAALAAEANRKGVDIVLGPTINLQRSPLSGRHFEAFSEDPYLTGKLAVGYIRGLQDHGVAATPKHYVANDFETERTTADVVADDRTLREVYLAPFEDAVVEGEAWMIMSAYNSVGGVTMTENPLLRDPLCSEWHFDGAVVSDWTAVRSTAASARARQDLSMPGPTGLWGEMLVAAVRSGAVAEEDINDKVHRILRVASRVGALDNVETETSNNPCLIVDSGTALAREVAAAGTVLVQNTDELPWDGAPPLSIAVIGDHALTPRTQGGGSATVIPTHQVSPFEGLQQALPDTAITWTRGVRSHDGIDLLPLDTLTDPTTNCPGICVRFLDVNGRVLLTENRQHAQLLWLRTAPANTHTVELRTVYRVPKFVPVRLGVACAGHVELQFDGVVALETELTPTGVTLGAALFDPEIGIAQEILAPGRDVEVTARYTVPEATLERGLVTIKLGAEPVYEPTVDSIAAAVRAARASEVAVVVVGTNEQIESESFDRTTLALPPGQDDLVRAVAAANPRTVVVVNAGSPVTMPWRHDVAAVLLTWFGGQEFGHALADVLIGRAEPGGRLPTTWLESMNQTPVLSSTPVNGTMRYDEGIHIGYRGWLRAGEKPAYPFGYGLGYTQWDIELGGIPAVRDDGSVELSVTVVNTGTRPGSQVVQVYCSRPHSSIDRPIRWLAGFARVHVAVGARETVRLTLPPRAFAHWDTEWRTEPGEFTLQIGTSSQDLPLTANVTIS